MSESLETGIVVPQALTLLSLVHPDHHISFPRTISTTLQEQAQEGERPVVSFASCSLTLDSLIAIMLGRLSMTVDECLKAYKSLAGRVFGHPRLLHMRNSLWPKDKYNGKILESVIEDIVKQREGSSSAAFPQRNEDMCRTYVVSQRGGYS